MGEITLSVPDDLDVALNVPPDEVPHALLLAAAVKWFEMGKISAGKASELAAIPKPLFLTKLIELGVSACTLSAEDIAMGRMQNAASRRLRGVELPHLSRYMA